MTFLGGQVTGAVSVARVTDGASDARPRGLPGPDFL